MVPNPYCGRKCRGCSKEDGLFVELEPDCSGPDVSAESVVEMMGVSLMADCGSSAIGLRPKPEALVAPLLEIEIVMFPGTLVSL